MTYSASAQIGQDIMAKKKELTGKITHYASSNGVMFSFQPMKKSKEQNDFVHDFSSESDLAFEIWKAFKDSVVKITITKE